MDLSTLLRDVRANRPHYLIHPCVLELGALVSGWQMVESSSRSSIGTLRVSSGATKEANYWQQVLFDVGDTEIAFERALDAVAEVTTGDRPVVSRPMDLFEFVLAQIEQRRLAAHLGCVSFSRLYAFLRGMIAAQQRYQPAEGTESDAAFSRFSDYLAQEYELATPWHLLLYGLHGDYAAVEAFASEWRRCNSD